jgi:hypothetical protein
MPIGDAWLQLMGAAAGGGAARARGASQHAVHGCWLMTTRRLRMPAGLHGDAQQQQ